jgi:glyoxylase-like metal-dependent hydrolase (beta-lactamase superfamily II)
VKVEKAADGVWHIAGGSHHSVAVEMADHVVLIEAPLGDGRVVPVIDAVKKTIPGKPIRAVVATHHHFDHSGGLRAAAAEDLTIISHGSNQAYFREAYAAPRTLAPDRLSRSGKTAKFQPVDDKLVLGDATRTLEIHHVKGNPHVVGLLIGYLPKEKILVVADAFSPRAPITKTPERINPNTANLWSNITELKLDVETVVPIHGRIAKVGELKLEAGAPN